MIVFQAKDYQLDLGLYGLTLNEENNMFVDNLIKSYSFPFNIVLTPEISQLLGLPEIDNITNVDSSIEGLLIIDDQYYDAVLSLGEIEGQSLECEITYGDEVLPVYGSKLDALPWPLHIIITSSALHDQYLDKSWPLVSHNFPMVYRPKIKQENDYTDFQLFCNNSTGTDFVQNVEETVEDEIFYRNKNVLMPCPYLLEILSFGFKSAGKKVRGAVLDDNRLKDLIYFPETFRQKFKGSTFTNWQFDVPDKTTNINVDNLGGLNSGIFVENIDVGIYEKTFTPDNIGTYNLKFNLNLDPVIADYFRLYVYRVDPIDGSKTYLYTSKSRFSRVNIEEELNLDVNTETQYHPIWISMELGYKSESIADLNSFEYSFKEGRLNELTGSYSLAKFMPDMTFGEYVNLLKNWLNLDITFKGEYVYIDFLETVVDELRKQDISHLEILNPKKTKNDKRTFRLKYSDESFALIDSTGQIYSDIDKNKNDIIEIDMGLQMAVVEQNHGTVTAVYPEDDAVTFALYPGLLSGKNVCRSEIEGFTGRIDNVYTDFWASWLAVRTNNLTITDTFMAHQSEQIGLRAQFFKYNHILLPKSIRKKRKLQEYWEIQMESETM